jgi:hypothetical protein
MDPATLIGVVYNLAFTVYRLYEGAGINDDNCASLARYTKRLHGLLRCVAQDIEASSEIAPQDVDDCLRQPLEVRADVRACMAACKMVRSSRASR